MMYVARIARFELPGKRWFFASCQGCRWVGLDWKDKEQARRDRDEHNRKAHGGDDTTTERNG